MVGPRNYPLAIASGVAVLLFSLVGGAAITGVLPMSSATHAGEPAPLEKTAAAAAARKVACKNCGVVAAVKAVDVSEDASGGGARAEHRSVYRVTVQMDDGSERTLSLAAAPGFSVGSRVRVNGHFLERG